MSNYTAILPLANQILKKHYLCDNCLGRLFSKQLHLSSNPMLGKKIKKNKKSTKKCYVCRNLFENLEHFFKLMATSSSDYSFQTFSVGTIIKPSIVDRDDEIRSKFKLRGIDSVKTDVTHELSKFLTRKSKKKVDTLDPDVTFTINLKEEECNLRSKSITISGRYVKNSRDLSQKQKSCPNCSGKGCRTCDFHGIREFDSVEGMISQLIFKKFGGTTAKFTWIGGEDKSSLVLGSGRPFFVKIQNPKKRNLRIKSVDLGNLKISKLKIVNESPKKPIKFNSTIKVKISSISPVSSKNLSKLKTLTKNPVVVYEKSGKRSEKQIFDLKYKKTSENSFTLFLESEGGLPLKRFVTADDVVPSISSVLDINCKCDEFDFLKIHVQ